MSRTGVSTLEDLLETFDLLDAWEDRYGLLIDLGRELPPMPAEEMVEENRVQGCQSAVWMIPRAAGNPPTIEFTAQSDSQIVRGLIAVLLMAYHGKTPQEVLGFDVRSLFERLGFSRQLSQSRTNGLFSMVKRLHEFARRLV